MKLGYGELVLERIDYKSSEYSQQYNKDGEPDKIIYKKKHLFSSETGMPDWRYSYMPSKIVYHKNNPENYTALGSCERIMALLNDNLFEIRSTRTYNNDQITYLTVDGTPIYSRYLHKNAPILEKKCKGWVLSFMGCVTLAYCVGKYTTTSSSATSLSKDVLYLIFSYLLGDKPETLNAKEFSQKNIEYREYSDGKMYSWYASLPYYTDRDKFIVNLSKTVRKSYHAENPEKNNFNSSAKFVKDDELKLETDNKPICDTLKESHSGNEDTQEIPDVALQKPEENTIQKKANSIFSNKSPLNLITYKEEQIKAINKLS
jgi:hypothetical protein